MPISLYRQEAESYLGNCDAGEAHLHVHTLNSMPESDLQRHEPSVLPCPFTLRAESRLFRAIHIDLRNSWNKYPKGIRLLNASPRSPNTAKQASKRKKGVEPSPTAWKAVVLPLNYSRRSGGQCRSPPVYFFNRMFNELSTRILYSRNCPEFGTYRKVVIFFLCFRTLQHPCRNAINQIQNIPLFYHTFQ